MTWMHFVSFSFRRGCRSVTPHLWGFVANTLPEGDLERIEAHLRQCETCRQEAAQYREALAALNVYRQQSVPMARSGWESLRARIVAEEAQTVPVKPFAFPGATPKPRWTKPLWYDFAMGGAAAASLLLFVVLAARVVPHTVLSSPGTSVAETPPADASPSPGMPSLTPVNHSESAANLAASLFPLPGKTAEPLLNSSDSGAEVTPNAPVTHVETANYVREEPRPAPRSLRSRKSSPPPVVTHPTLTLADYPVDGARPNSRTSHEYVMGSGVQNDRTPETRTYVMDSIPMHDMNPADTAKENGRSGDGGRVW